MPPLAIARSVPSAMSLSPRASRNSIAEAGGNLGAPLAVDLHAHEAFVHQLRGGVVLEGLALHDVAPVARAVADGDEQRLVLLACAAQRLLAPRQPVDGVLRVLAEVGGDLVRERVGHGVPLPG